nr:class I SAM-dependent methyltransferase [Microvirga puerhi]
MQGIDAPGLREEPLAYCELGCGQGLSTNVLAAANPHVQFYATDFNPTHVVRARALAEAGGLDNVQFFDDSFAEFLERNDLPPFDFVALHGIYSWISAENRRAIVEFARRRLKPGGILYASYNTMPGWASVMPLRRLLIEHAATQGAGSKISRIRTSLDFAERLSKLGTRYFASQPQLAERLAQIGTKDLNYIAHEYFNADLHPFYFIDVARDFAEAKLQWVGSASPIETIDELNLSEDQRKILSEIDDIALRETVRDHIVNQNFRKDIFIKGPVRLSRLATRERWLDTRFALSRAGSDIPSEVKGRGYSLKLQEEFREALTTALHYHPRSLREIVAMPGLAKHGIDKIKQALVSLVGQGLCYPSLTEQGLAERRRRTEAFNLAVATNTMHEYTYSSFASPITGNGIRVEQIDQMIWLAHQRRESDIAAFIWKTMTETGHRLAKDGKTLTQEEHMAEIGKHVALFEKAIGPMLQSLGIAIHASGQGTVRDLRLQA